MEEGMQCFMPRVKSGSDIVSWIVKDIKTKLQARGTMSSKGDYVKVANPPVNSLPE